MKTIRPRLSLPKVMALVAILVLCCTAFVAPQNAKAAPGTLTGPGWVVVASDNTVTDPVNGDLDYNAIYTVNTYTNEIHGPFLMDELSILDEVTGLPTGGRDLFDVAITPDGKTALVSSFGNQIIYFIDISDPLNPVFLGKLVMDMFAEDLAITADGKYALLTDGGFHQSVYSIDIAKRQVAYELLLPTIGHDSGGSPIYGATNAVAVSKTGTVVMADYFNGAIHSMTIGQGGTLTYYGTYRYYRSYDGDISQTSLTDYSPMRPVNVAIAPDDATVLVSDVGNYTDTTLTAYPNLYTVGVYKVTSPGQLQFVKAVTGLDHAMQSITFSEDGTQAIMLGNSAQSYDDSQPPASRYTYEPDGIFVMDIAGPGDVTFNAGLTAELPHTSGSQLFGVDGVAVYDGKAYATIATFSLNSTEYPKRYLSVVDLSTFAVTNLEWGATGVIDPGGLAVRQYIPYSLSFPYISQ